MSVMVTVSLRNLSSSRMLLRLASECAVLGSNLAVFGLCALANFGRRERHLIDTFTLVAAMGRLPHL